MHVVVVTKRTPDTAAKVTVDSSGRPSWSEEMVINPWDEYAVTEATLLQKSHSVKATVLTVGAEEHAEAIKYSLAIGCNEGVRVWDAALEGYDSLLYAKAVVAAIQKLGDVNLVIFGKEFADLNTDQHVYQVARKLGWTMLGAVGKILELDFAAKTIKVERMVEQGKQIVSAQLPAVISVLKDINEPKYPSLIGIRKAAKAEIPVWSLADLGLSASLPVTQVVSYSNPPKREGEVEMIEGATVEEKAAKLADKLIAEKVI